MGIFTNKSSSDKTIREIYAKVPNVSGVRTIKEVYVGVNGVPRRAWKKQIFDEGIILAFDDYDNELALNKKYLYSIDGGVSWIKINGLPSGMKYNHMAFGNGKFVICGTNMNLYASFDGMNFSSPYSYPPTGNPPTGEYQGICFGKNNQFVTIGTDEYKTNHCVIRSWTIDTYGGYFEELGSLPVGSGFYPLDIVYGNGIYVAAVGNGSTSGNDYSFYSTNGTSWNRISGVSGSVLKRIIFGNNRFVATSMDGAYYSTNGSSWNKMTGLQTSSGAINSLSFGNNRFICSKNNDIYYSTNGTSWIKSSNGFSSGYVGMASCYDVRNKWFVAIGRTSDGKRLPVIKSVDGVTWTFLTDFYIPSLRSIKTPNLIYGKIK